MSKPVIHAPPDRPLEEAARKMIDKKIGCLPVVDGDRLIGIITETDIFTALAKVLGGGHPSVGTFRGKRPDCIAITMRVDNLSRDHLLNIMKAENIDVLNLWEPTK
jgi:acetoin utilization protein AcuB